MTRDEQLAECRADLPGLAWGNAQVVLILGLGDGLIVEEARRHTAVPILVLEPRDHYREAWTPIEGVRVFPSVEPLRTALHPLIEEKTNFLSLVPEWWGDELQAYRQEFDLAARRSYSLKITGSNTALKMSKQWLERFLDAMPYIIGKPTANSMAGSMAGIPAVIVGAGPSLDGNVERIRDLYGRALVIACNTALLPVEAAGGHPDLVAIAEAKDSRAQLTRSRLIPEMTLLAGAHVHPAVYTLPWLRTLPVIGNHGPWARWFCRTTNVHPITSGGSVTTIAYGTALMLGCNPIILVGQDCAFKAERAYCSNSTHEDARVEFDGRVGTLHMSKVAREASAEVGQTLPYFQGEQREVEAWGGEGTVQTLAMYDDFRGWFEQSSYEARRSLGTRTINATEGGARMQGVEEMRLADVVEMLPVLETAPGARLAALYRRARPVQREDVVAALREQKREAAKFAKLAERGHDLIERLAKVDAEFRKQAESSELMDSWVGAKLKSIREDMGDEYKKPFSRTRALYGAAGDAALVELNPRIDALVAEVSHV